MSTYKTMTPVDLGDNATENDLMQFQAMCREAQKLHPDLDDVQITNAVWYDGDYYRGARRLGVDVASVVGWEWT